MNAAQPTNLKSTHDRVKWLAVALAMIAALAYVLIAQGVLPIGDLSSTEGPKGIIYTAAASYLLGGLLILVQRRWLWVLGAVVNGLVILFFVRLYQARPVVLFSPGGLVSKAAQVLLEVTLLYLIATYSRHPQFRAGI